MKTLNLAGIVDESVVDGPGIRFVVFAQGCKHACPGCFSQGLQEFKPVKAFAVEQIIEKVRALPHIKGITFSGGDPFEQSLAFAELADKCKELSLSIWCYTGYRFEELVCDQQKRILLEKIDVLVDSPFLLAEKNQSLRFKGSGNQRIIRVEPSLRTNSLVYWESTYGIAQE